MTNTKQIAKAAAFIGGIILCAVIYFTDLVNLEPQGKLCLGLTLMTVVWWVAQIAQSGYISGIYLALLCLLNVAKPSVVFASWTTSTIWLVIGAYLIAAAVRNSGLGERLSYIFILRFVRSYRSVIISIFVFTFIMSLLIPLPWPRAFLIMSVMTLVIRAAKLPRRDAVGIGFTVFAASVPVSLIFLTGDATTSPLAASYADEAVSFARWFVVIGVPAMLMSLLTMILIMIIFRPSEKMKIDLRTVRKSQKALGPMSKKEKITAFWVIVAVVLWMTNGITGLDLGWITLSVAMAMSLPVIGGALGAQDWCEIPVQVLIFLTAAIAIGKVGAVTGMNAWIAQTLMPASLPSNPYIMALVIGAISIMIHMCMGSVIAVMGIVIPAFMTFAQSNGIPQLAIIGLTYMSVSGHYILPFHHLNLLVGQGEENGMYSSKETIKLGVPLIAAIAVVLVFSIAWWKIIGLL